MVYLVVNLLKNNVKTRKIQFNKKYKKYKVRYKLHKKSKISPKINIRN